MSAHVEWVDRRPLRVVVCKWDCPLLQPPLSAPSEFLFIVLRQFPQE